MKKKLVLGFIFTLILLAMLGITVCSCLGGAQKTVSQQSAEVTRGDLTLSVTGDGKITASREARLTFGSGGKIDKILVKEGDAVKAGDVLAVLDTATLELALQQSQIYVTQAEVALSQAQLVQQTAENTLENTRDSEDALNLALLNAQIALDMSKTAYDAALVLNDSRQISLTNKQVEAAEVSVALAQKNIDGLPDTIALIEPQVSIAAKVVDQTQQALDLAERSLAEAQKELHQATIVAPFDGVVAMVLAEDGDTVTSPAIMPAVVIQMVDPASLELIINVDEIDIPLVKTGQAAVVTVEALPGVTIAGRVNAIYPVPMELGGVVLYRVRVSLDVPENSGIKVGMSASADIVAEKHADVLIVPSRAVGKNDRGEAVVKIKAGEQVEDRVVVVGLDDGIRTEVVSGLSEGETVIFEVKVKSSSGMSLF